MNLRLFLPVLLAAALLAGCGSSPSAKLSPGDIAAVGDQHVSQAQLAVLLANYKAAAVAANQPFPKAGTTAYQAAVGRAVSVLVSEAEVKIESKKLGVAVKKKAIDAAVAKLIKQTFGGDKTQFLAALKANGWTPTTFRQYQVVYALLEQAIADKLGKADKITSLAILKNYLANRSKYTTTDARKFRYLLVGKNKQALATSIYNQLKGASDKTWCTLVQKYSQDIQSKPNCGNATFSKGQAVPLFDKVLFSAGTNELRVFNTPQFGWFIMQPTAPVQKGAGAPTTPTKKVAAAIKASLLQQKKEAQGAAWFKGIQKAYCKGKTIKYQAGYAPNPDPCVAILATGTTTTGA